MAAHALFICISEETDMHKAAEGGVQITYPEGVFCNPEMELCRDVSSLAVGAIGGKLSVLDAFCASGIRGLRYAKENRNVKSLHLSDWSLRAVGVARKNARANKVKCAVSKGEACEILRKGKGEFEFVELDPFGSPAPFLHDAAFCLEGKDESWLSITATDMAVLCGAAHAACLKNYGAMPLDNEFCHENAVRILAGKAITTFSPFNLAAVPIYTLSHRHYVKVIFSVVKGADAAVDAVKKMGFISYCPGCCWREAKRIPKKENCPHCNHQLLFAGPLYLGELWNGELLEKMLALNGKRKYAKAAQIEKLLKTQLAESKIDAYGYYDLHVLAKKGKGKIIGMDAALERLRKGEFAAERTHFCPTAIRADAPHGKIVKLAEK